MKYIFLTLVLVFFCFYSPGFGEILIIQKVEVAQSAEDIKPLIVGSQVPSVELLDLSGSKVNLISLLEGKKSVLIFYRGGWCPYCNLQLRELRKIEKQVLEAGFQIIAISPDKPEFLNESFKKHNMNYSLYSDSEMVLAKAFGIAFKLDKPTFKKYLKFGLDIEKASGRKHHILPVPSVFIVDVQKKIIFSYVNPNYKIRLDSDILLAVIKASSN